MRIPFAVPRHTAIAIVVGVAVLVNCALFILLGFRLGGDARRYIDGADSLLRGEPLSARQQVYFGYIWLLAAAKWLSIDQRAIYVLQVAASCGAALAAFRLGCLYGGVSAGVVTGLVWALSYDIQKWNFYLLTESFFLSSVMVSCWLVMRSIDSRRNVALALVSILVMATLRINGVLFALAMLCVLIVVVRGGSRLLVAAAILLLVVMPSAAAVSPAPAIVANQETGLAREGTLGFLTEGQVIWDTIRIPMPPAGNSSGNLLKDLITYVVQHPLAVSRLYLYRLAHYLFAWNPRFSTKHTIVTTAQWLFIYAFGILGWVAVRRRGKPMMGVLPLLFAGQGILVMLTVGDYDGRYSLYAAPALFPFVGLGLSDVLMARLRSRTQAESV